MASMYTNDVSPLLLEDEENLPWDECPTRNLTKSSATTSTSTTTSSSSAKTVELYCSSSDEDEDDNINNEEEPFDSRQSSAQYYQQLQQQALHLQKQTVVNTTPTSYTSCTIATQTSTQDEDDEEVLTAASPTATASPIRPIVQVLVEEEKKQEDEDDNNNDEYQATMDAPETTTTTSATTRRLDPIPTTRRQRFPITLSLEPSASYYSPPSQQNTTTPSPLSSPTTTNASLSPPPSEEWRRMGQEKRAKLLQEDKRKGGLTFSLNPKCSIDRYFSVAQRAIQQFHDMVQARKAATTSRQPNKSSSLPSLEETYVMGVRMVSFLQTSMRRHPSFSRQLRLQDQVHHELVALKHALQELAYQIDEEECNRYADQVFDPTIHLEDDDSEEEEEPSTRNLRTSTRTHSTTRNRKRNPTPTTTRTTRTRKSQPSTTTTDGWVAFPSSNAMNIFATTTSTVVSSPKREATKMNTTSDTVTTTTSTSSLGSPGRLDFSSSSSDEEEEDYGHYYGDEDYDYRPRTPSLDFLERIAQEDVEYETDSEAADSWAQGGNDDNEQQQQQQTNTKANLWGSSSAVSSGNGITYDPARLAFRDLLARVRNGTSVLSKSASVSSAAAAAGSGRPSPPSDTCSRKPDPPAQVSPRSPETSREDESLDPEGHRHLSSPAQSPHAVVSQEPSPTSSSSVDEAVVESAIQRFLDSSLEDPSAVFEASMPRFQPPKLAPKTKANFTMGLVVDSSSSSSRSESTKAVSLPPQKDKPSRPAAEDATAVVSPEHSSLSSFQLVSVQEDAFGQDESQDWVSFSNDTSWTQSSFGT